MEHALVMMCTDMLKPQKKRRVMQKASSLGVSKNRGTPKSSILIGFSIINHPFWGTIIFGNTHFIASS